MIENEPLKIIWIVRTFDLNYAWDFFVDIVGDDWATHLNVWTTSDELR